MRWWSIWIWAEIRPILNNLISPTQSAFIPKRLIADNVLIAFELHHYINSPASRNRDYMTLKLDINKAYDRVEWSFLWKILLRFGLAHSFVDLIILCVSSVFFSFMLNGARFGELRPERGIHQGDPFLPYLFICMVEASIGMVNRAEAEGLIHGIKIAIWAPTVTNLCFGNDTLLFCQASEEEASMLKTIIDYSTAVSGQTINFDKFSITFSKWTALTKRATIVQILLVKEVPNHSRYLWMTSVVGRSKKEIYKTIRDRIWKK